MNDEREAEIRRLFQRLGQIIVDSNKRNFREIVGEVSEQDFVMLAEAISVCRAHYLSEVLSMAKSRDGALKIDISERLLAKRDAYNEALAGYDALQHALERGYFVLKE